ncbi:hypothetical protein MMC22_002314 [Lobaria immixta]|nr:hypothetical protein [Lobaria immixta]
MEVAGLVLGVMPMFASIMETVKIAISVYRHEEDLWMTQLYVERARLGEYARVLGVVSEGSPMLEPEHVAILQRLLTKSSEKLHGAQILIAEHGYHRSLRPDPVKFCGDLILARQDEPRPPGLIQHLTELNDHLYRKIMLPLLQKQSKTDDQSLSLLDYPTDESMSWGTSLVHDLWSSSVEGLEVIGEKALKSIALRRTFRRAIVRLKIWHDGFDFDLSQIELVLGTNEYLYEAVVVTLSRLVYFLWTLRNAAQEENVALSFKFQAHIGRTIERIKSAEKEMSFSIEDVDESEVKAYYRPLFIERPGENGPDGLEMRVKQEVNRHCTVVFDLIGAIDRARKRHVWLLDLGKRSRGTGIDSSENKLSTISHLQAVPQQGYITSETILPTKIQNPISASLNEILEIGDRAFSSLASPATAKQLLSTNIEAATTLYKSLQAQADNMNNSKFPREMSTPEVILQLEHNLGDELMRLENFSQEVGTELDGRLAKRNGQIQEAATFALKHMSYVLSQALGSGQSTQHRPIPHSMHLELSIVAVRGFHDMNDSLTKLLESIKIAETLSIFGGFTVMRSSLRTAG